MARTGEPIRTQLREHCKNRNKFAKYSFELLICV